MIKKKPAIRRLSFKLKFLAYRSHLAALTIPFSSIWSTIRAARFIAQTKLTLLSEDTETLRVSNTKDTQWS